MCDILSLFLGKVHFQSQVSLQLSVWGYICSHQYSMLTPNCSLATSSLPLPPPSALSHRALQGPRAVEVRQVWDRRLNQAATPACKSDGCGVGCACFWSLKSQVQITEPGWPGSQGTPPLSHTSHTKCSASNWQGNRVLSQPGQPPSY